MNDIKNHLELETLPKPIIASCFLAGCLEMYDFAIFGFFTSLLNRKYLSFLDENNAAIITYALFAVGFLFRPLGSLMFGYIGDVYGRKPALVLSVTMMGLAALGMCLLPSYETIGVSACYIIAIIRIVQGLSVGGEYNGAAIYAIEHTKAKNIGLVGATVTAGSTLGLLLATYVSKVVQNPELPDYSWRLAFLLGFGLSIVGYVIRKKLRESPIFDRSNNIQKGIPLLKSFRFLKVEFLAAVFTSAANNANFYFLLIFLPNYLKTRLPFDIANLGLFMTILILILVPIFGYISDKIGRANMIVASCLGMMLYNLFFIDLVLSASGVGEVIAYVSVSTIFVALMVSTINIFVIEIFPPKFRFSNTALSYSLGAAIFGGTVPMVAALIIEKFGDTPSYIGNYIAFVSLIGAISTIAVRLKNKRSQIIKKRLLDLNHLPT